MSKALQDQILLIPHFRSAQGDDKLGDTAGGDDAQGAGTIGRVWKELGYLCDTHTASGWAVAEDYVNQIGDHRPMVVLSTASPYKFPAAVLAAIGGQTDGDEFALMERLNGLTGVAIPKNLAGLKEKPELHKTVIGKDEMLDFVLGL